MEHQARLSRFLRVYYTELALKEPLIPSWAQPIVPGSLSPARLEPELRLHPLSHGNNECITVDQILAPINVSPLSILTVPFTSYCHSSYYQFICIIDI